MCPSRLKSPSAIAVGINPVGRAGAKPNPAYGHPPPLLAFAVAAKDRLVSCVCEMRRVGILAVGRCQRLECCDSCIACFHPKKRCEGCAADICAHKTINATTQIRNDLRLEAE